MVALIVFISALVIDLLTDVPKIRKGEPIRHGWSALVRTIALTAGSYYQYDWNFWTTVAAVFCLTVLYWICFDLLINLSMGWDRWYSGTTSWIDRVILRGRDEAEFMLKCSLLILTFGLFTLVKKKQDGKGNSDR